jgi:hypothetical protein
MSKQATGSIVNILPEKGISLELLVGDTVVAFQILTTYQAMNLAGHLLNAVGDMKEMNKKC